MIDDALEQIKQLLSLYESGDLLGAEKSARVVLGILQAKIDKEDFACCYIETNVPSNEKLKYIKLVRQNYTIGLFEAKKIAEVREFRPIILRQYLNHREIRDLKEKYKGEIRAICKLYNEHDCFCDEFSMIKNS